MANPKVEAVCYRGEFVRSMGEGSISVERVILITGQNLKAGTVLGKITASGKYTQLTLTGSTGQQIAAGVLWEDTDATAGDVPVTAVVRMAELKADLLTYPDAISGPQKDAAIAALAAANVIVRA